MAASQMANIPSSASSIRIPWVIAFLLIFIHIMLPVGNSLPAFKLGDIPIHLPMVIYPLFGLHIIRLYRGLPQFRMGLLLLLVFTGIQVISLVYTQRIREGSYECLMNFYSLAGTYSIAWVVIVGSPQTTVRKIFILCLLCAASIGILERIYSQPIWPYNLWYSGWFFKIGSVSTPGELLDTFRIWGTQGNPINYASIMLLGVPWVMEDKGYFRRTLWGFVLLIAALFTLSRTILLYGFPLLAYIFIIQRYFSRNVKILLGMTCMILLCVIGIFWGNNLLELWQVRMALENASMNEGVAVREEIFYRTIYHFIYYGNPLFWAIGFGQGAGALMANQVLSFLDTLDNAYLAILFQNGVVGLYVYLKFWHNHYCKIGKSAYKSIHFWMIIGYLLSGVSFEMYHFFGLNFMVFCSLAWLIIHGHSSGRNLKSHEIMSN